MTARAPVFRALAAAALAGLSLSACASGPPDRPGGRGPGGPPPGMDHPPGRDGAPGDRPQLFISPAGEPFRAAGSAPYPVQLWFDGADANHDGALSRDEFVADATRFFAALDADHDGVVDGFEVSTYERTIVPEILLGSGFSGRPEGGGPPGGRRGGPGGRGGPPGGGLEGASPYSLLAEPQPVIGADADFNRRISRDEAQKAARARFGLLDLDRDGVLRLAELPQAPVQERHRPGKGPDGPRKARPGS